MDKKIMIVRRNIVPSELEKERNYHCPESIHNILCLGEARITNSDHCVCGRGSIGRLSTEVIGSHSSKKILNTIRLIKGLKCANAKCIENSRFLVPKFIFEIFIVKILCICQKRSVLLFRRTLEGL